MNIYNTLPDSAFWRPSVADRDIFDITGLWAPKFRIEPSDPVVTYGSCFAQQIGIALKERGCNWLRTERPPYGLSAKNQKAFYYDIFSCRTGNIYTTSLLNQWVSWSLGTQTPPDLFWETDGRTHDPFRPVIEPGGFASKDEAQASRVQTITAFRNSIEAAKCFVFTLGLTENWFDAEHGQEYPMCPGTAAGQFDPEKHLFRNHDYEAVKSHLESAIEQMRAINPGLKVLLTVSPVPMTATNSGEHVVVATMYTKSILRAVAGALTAQNDFIDYFPGYEMVNSPAFKGIFFGPNQRNVSPQGVSFVMDQFADAIGLTSQASVTPITARSGAANPFPDRCEEEMLEAFRKAR